MPELKRTGYKKALYNQKPLDLFRILQTDSKAETLIKAGYTKLLKRIMDSGWKDIDNYWQSIRICIRNHYKIKDATLWCDYIDLLRFFGKDLHNAKYVCPDNLKTEHDRYVAKKEKADALLEIEKQLAKEDSLILSACIDGKRIETIEVSISQLKIIQSRGVCNKNTKYHNQIINLVEQNIPLFEERLVAL